MDQHNIWLAIKLPIAASLQGSHPFLMCRSSSRSPGNIVVCTALFRTGTLATAYEKMEAGILPKNPRYSDLTFGQARAFDYLWEAFEFWMSIVAVQDFPVAYLQPTRSVHGQRQRV